MEDRFIDYQGHKVHYGIAGDAAQGRPVVLLHGFTEAIFVWENLSRRLSEKGFYVVAIDLAGHGRTEMFAHSHTMELQAGIVQAVMHAEKIDKAVMIGHSMGGYVAAAFACLYPAQVAGVGFFHSNPSADTEAGRENRLRTLTLLEAGHTSFMNQFTADLFAPGTAQNYPHVVAALQASSKNMGAEAIAAAQRGMLERPSRLAVYDLPVPFLFIIGKQDAKADVPKLMAQSLLPQQSHVHLLPCGHMGMYECPTQTETQVCAFAALCFS